MIFSKVIGIIASEASAGIEHPLRCFLSDGLREKFLDVIAAQIATKLLTLFRAHRQEFLRRESIMCPAFETHYRIQSIACIGLGDLLTTQYRQFARKILLGQFNAEIRRKV